MSEGNCYLCNSTFANLPTCRKCGELVCNDCCFWGEKDAVCRSCEYRNDHSEAREVEMKLEALKIVGMPK
jgi:hypothetical protein